MDIGKINNNFVNNTIDTTKNKVTDGSFESRLQSAMDKGDEQALRKACDDFESIFLSMMYKQMKATVPKSELIPGDAGRDIFESMMDDELMGEASKSRSFGLADTLYKQLDRQLKSTYKSVGKGEDGSAEEK